MTTLDATPSHPVTTRPTAHRPSTSTVDLQGNRIARRLDRCFTGGSLTAGLAVLVILAGVIVSTTLYAWPALRYAGWEFLTGTRWSSSANTYGALALIYGTLVTSTLAVALATPLSIGVALFSIEVCPRRLRGIVTGLVDLLAAVPSVVFGLVGLLALREPLQRIYQAIAGPTASGASFATAGVVVAAMITPIITSLTREVIRTIPDEQRQAAYALGATRTEVIRRAVLPAASGGIVSAVMIGLGRALGETVAVALVVGGSAQITADLTQPGETMAGIIANTFNGEGDGLDQQALMGLGVVLFVITLAVNAGARALVLRANRTKGRRP